MRPQCPRCARRLAAEALDVAANLAPCPCGVQTPLDELAGIGHVRSAPAEAVDICRPPPGCRLRTSGDELRIVAALRSRLTLGLGLTALGFAGFGAVWAFGAGRGGGGSASWPLRIVDLVFHGVPLLIAAVSWLVAAIAGWFALVSLLGRCRIAVTGDELRISEGIPPLARRWRLPWSEVRRVVEIDASWSINGRPGRRLRIESDEVVAFGGMLRQDRRAFVHAVLTERLAQRR